MIIDFLAITPSPVAEREAERIEERPALVVGVAVVTNVMSMPRTLPTWSYSTSGKISCSVTPKL